MKWLLALFLLLPILVGAKVPEDIPNKGLTLYPTKIFLEASPSEIASGQVVLINNTEEELILKASVEDFSLNSESLVDFKSNQLFSLKDSIDISNPVQVVGVGDRAVFDFSVYLPSGVSAGSLFSAIVIDSETVSGDVNQINFIPRLASLVFVRVPGEVYLETKIESLKVVQNSFVSNPEAIDIVFRNNSNVHLVSFGELTLTNIFGQEIMRTPVDAFVSLPESLRTKRVELNDVFLFGFYKAEVSLNSGFNDDFLNNQASFWVFPWYFILVLFLFLIILVYFLFHRPNCLA